MDLQDGILLGSGKRRIEIHAWQNKNIRHQSMDKIGQRCPCIHYPAFYPRISWSGGSRQCGPSGYNNPGPLLWIDPSSLTGPLFFRLEHCATIWTGPQTSSRIRRWLFCVIKRFRQDICLYLLLDQADCDPMSSLTRRPTLYIRLRPMMSGPLLFLRSSSRESP